jgi:hypothetical protein
VLARVDILRIQALLEIRESRWQAAEHVIEEALALCHAVSHVYAEAKTLHTYGQLSAAMGDLTRARGHYEHALAICDRLGEGLYRTSIERDLRRLAQQAYAWIPRRHALGARAITPAWAGNSRRCTGGNALCHRLSPTGLLRTSNGDPRPLSYRTPVGKSTCACVMQHRQVGGERYATRISSR